MLRIAVETLNKTLQGINECTWFKGTDTGYGKCSLWGNDNSLMWSALWWLSRALHLVTITQQDAETMCSKNSADRLITHTRKNESPSFGFRFSCV